MKQKTVIKTILVTLMFSAFTSMVVLAKEGRALIPYLSDSEGEYKAAYEYYNEDNSKLKNDWKQINGDWYYFGDDGVSKQSMWFEVDGKWYYFDDKSIMLHDTTTPDGYTVGADGAWITE